MPPSARQPSGNAPLLAHLGWALRQQRVALNLERDQAAAALRYSVEVVKKVENGVYHADIGHYLARWHEVYGLDDAVADLWARVRAERTPEPLGELATLDVDVAVLLLPPELLASVESLGLPEMERRRLLSLIVNTMGATGGLLLTGDDTFDRLAHALTRPSATDANTARHLEARTVAFHQLEEHLPSRLIQPSLKAHLNALAGLLDGNLSAPVRRTLTQATGEAVVLAGWLAFDLGDQQTAERLYALAIDAARTSGDDALYACALGYMSYGASANGDAKAAVRLLEGASRAVPGPSNPATRAWLAGRQAEELAKLGESNQALAVLDVARSAFEQTTPRSERVWTCFLDEARFRSLELHTLVGLELPAKVKAAEIDMLTGLPEPVEVKTHGTVLADVATAHLQLGNVDQACELAERALDQAHTTECFLPLERLREFRAYLQPWAHTRAAIGLAERLQTI